MKPKTIRILALVLALVWLLALPSVAQAAGKPSLKLAVKPSKVAVGQEVTVEVDVKNASPVYGLDVRLVFDPNLWEVVDADPQAPGLQFEPGTFIDPSKSFILQNGIDGQSGAVDYALTLLNPAPEAQGNGQVLRVTLRARAAGSTTISISEGMFGTRNGTTIAPALDSTQISIAAQSGTAAGPTPGGAATGRIWLFAGLAGVALVCIGLVGFRYYLRRTRAG